MLFWSALWLFEEKKKIRRATYKKHRATSFKSTGLYALKLNYSPRLKTIEYNLS